VAIWQSVGFEILATVPDGFRHPTLGLAGLHIMTSASDPSHCAGRRRAQVPSMMSACISCPVPGSTVTPRTSRPVSPVSCTAAETAPSPLV
jgi:hypothetical protein